MNRRIEGGTRGAHSPFPAMDAGSAALKSIRGAEAEGRRDDTEPAGITTGLEETVAPEELCGCFCRGQVTEGHAPADSPRSTRKEYAIDAASARSLNLSARYAVRRPLVLSWKTDGSVVGGRPGAPADSQSPAGTGDAHEGDIIELTDVVFVPAAHKV